MGARACSFPSNPNLVYYEHESLARRYPGVLGLDHRAPGSHAALGRTRSDRGRALL
jgi:hypothetical protein